MVRGTVKWFDSKKGFGFITDETGGKDIFIHYSNIEGNDFRSLKHGEAVEFEMVETEKGPQARNLRSCAEPDSDDDA